MDENANLLIVDAVKDQNKTCWFRLGAIDNAVWFSFDELQSGASSVFSRLSRIGIRIVTDRSKNELKTLVEAVSKFRPALVADRPGWVGDAYVFGNGEVAKAAGGHGEVIIAFEPDRRYASSGHDLESWQETLAPLVMRQPLLLFAMGLSLVGPLLRFAPPDVMNPVVEFVGDPENGKTAGGVLGASLWGGLPGSGIGCGEDWDFSPRAIDDMKQRRSDGFLFLDEVNLLGSSGVGQARALHDAIFRLSSTGQRLRFGEGPAVNSHRLAILSTANQSLAALAGKLTVPGDALRTRILSIEITGRPLGILESVPADYLSSKEAIEALQQATATYFGIAGRAFVRKLIVEAQRTDFSFESHLAQNLGRASRLLSTKSARHNKTLAMVMVAIFYAQKFKVFPKNWGDPRVVVSETATLMGDSNSIDASAKNRVLSYASKYSSRILHADDLTRQSSDEALRDAAGFWLPSGMLFIPTQRLKNEFDDCEMIVRRLRDLGLAKTEEGKQPKLSIKTPRCLGSSGRGYCIDFEGLTARPRGN